MGLVQTQVQLKGSTLTKKKREFLKIRRLPVLLHPMPATFFYRRELFALVKSNKDTVDAMLKPHLPSLVLEADRQLSTDRMDDYADDATRLIETTTVAMIANSPIVPEPLAIDVALRTAKWNDEQVQKLLRRAFGINIFQSEPWLTPLVNSFAQENVRLIKSITEKDNLDINTIVLDGLSSGSTAPTIAKDLDEIFKKDRNRAKLISRDQVSKLNGQIANARQTNLGITNYVWRSSDDARVRPSHNRNDDKVFSWDRPPFDTGHPGHDINCRCYAEPVLIDLLEDV